MPGLSLSTTRLKGLRRSLTTLGAINKGGGVPGFVIPDAVYLPSVGSTPVVAVGARRVVTAYSGPILQVQRASDNATMDVPQDAKGVPDTASVVSWAAGSQTRVRTWYDQSGAARHLTTTIWAEMPIYDAAGIRGQAAAHNAFKAMMFDGWLDVPSGNVRRPKRLTIPTSVTFELQNHTMFMVIDPKSAIYNDVYYGLKNSSGAQRTALGTATALAGIYASNSPSNTVGNLRARQNYQALGVASGVSSFKFHQDGTIFTASNSKWQETMTGGLLGDDVSGSLDFLSEDNFLAFVIYPTALTDANASLVRDALNATFGLPTAFTSVVVQVGDSIKYGPTVIESLEGRTDTRLIRPSLKGTPAIYNMGLSSQLLSGSGQLAANASTREDLLIAASTGFSKRVLDIEIGTNDIGAGATGATVYSAMATYVSGRRSAGATHIILRTLLPRSGSYTAEINAYNALVRANSIGADAIADVAAHPVMGLQASVSDLALYQDGLHPTGYGYSLFAPIVAAAINSVL
ncbi:MAG: arabinofuranosidase catalytic domain-containing protein [Neorhizobium sp.]|nr:arabinofuranosidase catalytic domain-containing protein [Neorhizobium sp.]